MKIKMVCPKCSSDEGVVRDAYASWDNDTQEWLLASVYDSFACNECGANDITPIEEELGEDPG